MPPKRPSENVIRELVEKALSGDIWRLHRQYVWTETGLPILLKALEDPRADLMMPGSKSPHSFAQSVIGELARQFPRESVAAARLHIDSERCRGSVLALLGRSGSALGGEILGNMMMSEDSKVVRDAWRNIALPQFVTGPEPAFFDNLWPGLQRVLRETDGHDYVMLIWKCSLYDCDKTVGFLESEGVLKADHPKLPSVLTGFEGRARLGIGGGHLARIFHGIVEHFKGSGEPNLIRYGLPNLARTDPLIADHWIEELKSLDVYPVKETLVETRAVRLGVDQPRFPEYSRGIRGLDGLSLPQRNYIVAYAVDAEVCNGGFSQFFTNPSGAWTPYALTALEAVGASRAASLMREATSVLGLDFEPLMRSQDTEVYDAIANAAVGKNWSALDSAYFGRSESVLDLLKVYTVQNSSEFRGEAS
ncbi:MAG: DUF4375 domain-containing protein [Planctomycetota bacterium]